MSLSSSEKTQFAIIIDEILESGDLTTISSKQIRKSLQARLDYDISEKKQDVQKLIMERFDHASSSTVLPPSSAPTNGHSSPIKTEASKSQTPQSYSSDAKEEEDEDSDVESPPKKKRKENKPADDDAKLAAKLQAQENSRSRSTRGGNEKKRVVKKPARAKKEKKKSADRVKKDDDSDLELNSDGEVKEKPKKGGFHKSYHLSAPLADIVGEPTLSRPQVVKKIWDYVRSNDLQNPSDKRFILCDDKLQLVFKQDKVHMFTMNKLLGKHLYDVEE